VSAIRALLPLLLATGLLASGCAARAPARAAGSDAPTAGPRGFPNPVLVSQDGERVRFYDDLVKDRLLMVHFAYTRCTGSCPRSTANLVEAQRLLRERGVEIPLVTISLDPENDTPAAVRAYVARHGAPAGWRYLTGAPSDLERLRVFLGFRDPNPEVDRDRSQHLAMVLIGNDRADRWVGVPAGSRPELIATAAFRTAAEGARPPLAMPAAAGCGEDCAR
jgi:protein SCO1/2